MFGNPLWQQLHTKIVRYIAPYDAAVRGDAPSQATAWIHAAEAQHQQVLVAFYHSEHTPTRLPSVAHLPARRQEVREAVPARPPVPVIRRGQPRQRPGAFSSPSATLAAQYYQALLRSCNGCTVIGLDVLDANNIGPTLKYIAEFKREIGRLRTIMPKIWGCTTTPTSTASKAGAPSEIDRALGGQVWLTETGGIVQFGGAFPNRNGSGLRARRTSLKYMFALARSQPQIKRLYLYDWTGGNAARRASTRA